MQAAVNAAPSVTSATDAPDPVTVGNNIAFTVNWTDPDAGDLTKIHLCKTNAINAPTQTCSAGSWYNSAAFSGVSPTSGNYTALVGDIGAQNYFAFVCDDENACSASTAGTFTVQAASFNFSLSMSTTFGSVSQGGAISPTLSALLVANPATSVTFSAGPVITGVTYNFWVASCDPNCNTKMTISTSASTPIGSYPITITATGGGVTRTTNFTLQVTAVPGSCDSSYPNDYFRACYFDGTSLSGTFLGMSSGPNVGSPAITNVWAIDNDWMWDKIFGNEDDTISAVWRGRINFPEGNYTLTVSSDDGFRLYVNEVLVFDQWKDQRGYWYQTLSLNGYTNIKVEWYESTGFATFRFGWDKITKQATINPSPAKFDFYIIKQGDVCLVGNPCISGSCIKVYRSSDGSVYKSFQDDGDLKGLKPSDPSVDSYPQKVCLSLTFTDSELAEIQGYFDTLKSYVPLYTYGGIQPSSRTIQFTGEISMSSWSGFWTDAKDIQAIAQPYLSSQTDFVLGVNSNRGIETVTGIDLYTDTAVGCGGTRAVDAVGGAGYSWINHLFQQPTWCRDHTAPTHEWLHQLDFSLDVYMNFSDYYGSYFFGTTIPFDACGMGPADKTSWFPSVDTAYGEPDSLWCGRQNADNHGDNNAHVLGEHYDTSRAKYGGSLIIGNHCRNKVRDFLETGVDIGGGCPDSPTRYDASPSGTLPAGTTSATLFLTTNKNATCKYSTTAGVSYDLMTNTFSATGGISHSTQASGLSNGNTYNYYIRCTGSGANPDDFLISFAVAAGTPNPDEPTNFTAAPGDTQIVLNWTKGAGANRTMVRRSATGFPATIADGVQVYFNTGTTYTDIGLTNGTTYYYSAWSEITVGGLTQYSDLKAQVSAVPAVIVGCQAHNVSGYAWSENIGWISVSCANTMALGSGVNFGLDISSGSGLFAGYAWSENIGWVDFAASGPYPALPNYSACADFPGSGQTCDGIGNYNVGGWARAVAYGGGWDGWIKLRGTNYGVAIDNGTGDFSGYGWSDAVIGWIRFAGTNYKVKSTLSFNSPPDKPSTFDVDWNRCAFRGSAIPTFSWTYSDSDNVPVGADPQTAYEIEVDEDSAFNAPKFNHLVTGAAGGSTSYVLNIYDDDENPDNLPPTMQDYQLDWDERYWWHVKVRDSNGNWSDWSSPKQSETDSHASPWVDFTWEPPEPTQGEIVEFIDQTEPFGGASIESWLWTIKPPGIGVFVDSTTNASQNPHIIFSTINNTVRLEVTDSDNYSCYNEKEVIVQLPLPEYKEIAPITWLKNIFQLFTGFLRYVIL